MLTQCVRPLNILPQVRALAAAWQRTDFIFLWDLFAEISQSLWQEKLCVILGVSLVSVICHRCSDSVFSVKLWKCLEKLAEKGYVWGLALRSVCSWLLKRLVMVAVSVSILDCVWFDAWLQWIVGDRGSYVWIKWLLVSLLADGFLPVQLLNVSFIMAALQKVPSLRFWTNCFDFLNYMSFYCENSITLLCWFCSQIIVFIVRGEKILCFCCLKASLQAVNVCTLLTFSFLLFV